MFRLRAKSHKNQRQYVAPMDFLRNQQYFHGRRAKVIYNVMARKFRDVHDWRFMNYGYAKEDGSVDAPLFDDEIAEKYPAALYHLVASQVDVAGKDVLDVGSGRGGGARYIHRHLGANSTTGMDLSEAVVDFCNQMDAEIDGLTFVAGDALDMPFDSASVDVVTNVESAHCYPDKNAFLSEVHRVLRPGGHFLITDFSKRGESEPLNFSSAGLELVDTNDITAGVVRALELDHARKEQRVRQGVPWGFRKLVMLWAGGKGSWIHSDFADGHRRYVVYNLKKPD